MGAYGNTNVTMSQAKETERTEEQGDQGQSGGESQGDQGQSGGESQGDQGQSGGVSGKCVELSSYFWRLSVLAD